MTYGYDVVEPDQGQDPFVELAEKAVAQFSTASTAGAFLVDFIPWSAIHPSIYLT